MGRKATGAIRARLLTALGAPSLYSLDRLDLTAETTFDTPTQERITDVLTDIGNLPIKNVNGTTVYVRDVANVRDGYAPQQSIVHVAGKKSVLMTILKHGSAIARTSRSVIWSAFMRWRRWMLAMITSSRSRIVSG